MAKYLDRVLLCPEILKGADFKSSGLICLAEEILRLYNVQSYIITFHFSARFAVGGGR